MRAGFVCNMCGKLFTVETSLKDHNRAVHTEVESPCSLCDKLFRSKKSLRYHIKSTHAEKEPFNCEIKSDGIQCIYYSVTNSNLSAHKKRVHEKPINTNLAKSGFYSFCLIKTLDPSLKKQRMRMFACLGQVNPLY